MKKLKEHVQVQCYYRTSISAQICSGLWGPRFRPSHPKLETAKLSNNFQDLFVEQKRGWNHPFHRNDWLKFIRFHEAWSRNVDETIHFTGTIDSNLSGFMKHATEVRYKSAEQRRIVKTQAILLTRWPEEDDSFEGFRSAKIGHRHIYRTDTHP